MSEVNSYENSTKENQNKKHIIIICGFMVRCTMKPQIIIIKKQTKKPQNKQAFIENKQTAIWINNWIKLKQSKAQ